MVRDKFKKIVIAAIASGFIYLATNYARGRVKNLNLKRKAEEKLKKKLLMVPVVENVDEEIERFILALNVCELAHEIKQKRISCVQVMSVYVKRAYRIGRELKLTAEECFEDAMREAKKCDEELENGEIRGVLHGVPISVKDSFSMKGYQTTTGLSCKLDYTDTETSILIEILKSQGAIPFVRSNLSQGMMWVESTNHIYGRALNPWDQSRTPGGSSGGEAGLVASRASPLGIGCDSGGSIRAPCTFCGVYGFVPTPGRLPKAWILDSKVHNAELNEQVIEFSYGPIGRCVEDLAMVIQIWFSSDVFSLHPGIVPLPFNLSTYHSSHTLKIGIFIGNPYFPVATCIKSSLSKCQNSLQSTSKIQSYTFPQFEKLAHLFNTLFSISGNSSIYNLLQGEDPIDDMKLAIFVNDHPYLTSFIMKILKFSGHKRMVKLFDFPATETPTEFLKLFSEIQDTISETIENWQELELDCVICPAVGVVAVPHFQSGDVIPSFAYSYIWNLIGFCCGVVPVGVVSKDEAGFVDDFEDLLSGACKKVMEDSEGLPYGLQVVGLPFKDEVVLNVMKRLENVFGFHEYAL